jgi:4-hydroxythreonine-4-phosphate dehydrogenase
VTKTVAVTLGDPRGIGPEVMGLAVEGFLKDTPRASILLLGPSDLDPRLCPYESVGPWDGSQAGAGRITAEAIRRGIHLSRTGSVGALVTGPAHKPALREAGWEVPGQTEMLQQLAGAPTVGMLMCAESTSLGPPLRVLLATTHLPLRELFQHLTPDLLLNQALLLAESLRNDWQIPNPRLAYCAVNPHAGDQGLFGTEEEILFPPALSRLEESGVNASGPFPADTVFRRAMEGEFDAVIAPYHDVGMAAFKSVSFGSGVNVTLGLPLIRTSPDHGTAFDLVGTGTADPRSAKEAVRLAYFLMANRFLNGADPL